MSNRVFPQAPLIRLHFGEVGGIAGTPDDVIEVMTRFEGRPTYELSPEEAEFRIELRRRGLEESKEHIREVYREAPQDNYYITICGSLHDPEIWRMFVDELGEEKATMIRDAYDRLKGPAWWIFNLPLRGAKQFLNDYEEGAGDRIAASHIFGHFIAVIVGFGGLLDVVLST